MLSKLSVRKPYTVLVMVVLILVLGFLSLRSMSTDLLPSMELPYAVIMTSYPGASPEEVETVISKPIEQAMAGITNVKEIQSISNGNVSLVILEFNEGTDMNASTIDMRESLDMLTTAWDDVIGNPTIMKLNPDMIPVMVAAVSNEGMDSVKNTEKVENDILPEIENIEGVASVTTSGNVKKEVQVIIQQDKIDKMNQKVKDAINGKLEKAENKIQKNLDKIEDGKDTLEQKQQETATKLAEGEAAIAKNSDKMGTALNKINKNLKTLKSKSKQLSKTEKKLKKTKATLKVQKKKLSTTIKTLKTTKNTLETTKKGLESLKTAKQGIEAQIAAVGEIPELKAQLDSINTQLNMAREKLKENGMSEEDLDGKIKEVSSGLSQAQAGLTKIKQGLKKVNTGLSKLKAGKTQIAAALTKLTEAKKQLKSGQISVAEASKQISIQKTLAAIKLSSAESDVKTGSSKLKEAKQQLKEQKKTTKEQANLNKLITKDMVEKILAAENFDMPAGYITDDKTSYLVRVGDKVENTEDVGKLVICDMGLDDLDPIQLSDVADVIVSDDSEDTYTVVNGEDAMALVIEKASGHSTGEVSKALKKKMKKLEGQNEGLHFDVVMDQGIYIDMVVQSVLQNLAIGGILAILILFLFLWDIRPTLIVACSIPLSVVSAIVLMYFSGVTLNVISLSGLALGVGMLVDNSVVVIENIFRLRNEEGYSYKKAAIYGATQVAGAILASTLTTIFVFAPIIFTEGLTRELFMDLALTLAYSLLASLFISLTLVPAMSQGLLRRKKEQKESHVIGKITDSYEKVLRVLLKKRWLVVLASFVILIGSAVIAFTRGASFMPSMESEQMSGNIRIPEGVDMEDQELKKYSDQVLEQMKEVDGVETVCALMGGTSMMSSMQGDSGGVSVYLLLDENTKRTNREIKEEIVKKTKDIPVDVSLSESTMDISSYFGSGITLYIKGRDLDKLNTICGDLKSKIEKVEGVKNVSYGDEDPDLEFDITVDKAKAMNYSLTVAQVFEKINAKIKESTKATTINTDTDDLEVFVTDESDKELVRKDLKRMKIEYTDPLTQKSKKVRLKKIADFHVKESPSSIYRHHQTRYLTISAEVDESHNIALVSQDVQNAIKDYQWPEGYSMESTGEDETIMEAMKQVALLFIVGVIFMYLIMVAQFQSLLSPFIILFTIPLAFTGGFLGLIFSGSDVSVIAMIGFVMLSGIIVNNGIVLVDYINQLRRKGKDTLEATVEAGRTRLRPILMTALTTILGLIPMLVSRSNGSAMVRPMAIVTVGGLIYGTLLTLFVIPCIYGSMHRKNKNLQETEEE